MKLWALPEASVGDPNACMTADEATDIQQGPSFVACQRRWPVPEATAEAPKVEEDFVDIPEELEEAMGSNDMQAHAAQQHLQHPNSLVGPPNALQPC